MAFPKNRPHWRAPLGHGPRNARPPAPVPYGWGRGPWPDAMRCKAITRATGERCRNPRVSGAGACNKHGGHASGTAAERKRCAAHGLPFLSFKAAVRPRKGLATLGALFGSPEEPSILERGRRLERTPGDGS